MDSVVNMQSVFVTDLVGVAILVIILVTRGWNLPGRKTTCLHMIFFWLLCAVEIIFLTVNFFTPVVFEVDSTNHYQRGAFYILFVVLGFILIFYGYAYYIINKFKNPSIFTSTRTVSSPTSKSTTGHPASLTSSLPLSAAVSSIRTRMICHAS